MGSAFIWRGDHGSVRQVHILAVRYTGPARVSAIVQTFTKIKISFSSDGDVANGASRSLDNAFAQ